jgi:hypothetical protein
MNHIKGKENELVDALNRRLHEIHSTSTIMYNLDLKIKNLEISKSLFFTYTNAMILDLQ